MPLGARDPSGGLTWTRVGAGGHGRRTDGSEGHSYPRAAQGCYEASVSTSRHHFTGLSPLVPSCLSALLPHLISFTRGCMLMIPRFGWKLRQAQPRARPRAQPSMRRSRMVIFILGGQGTNPIRFHHTDNMCDGSVAHGGDTAAALCPQWEVSPSSLTLFLLTVVPPGGPRLPPGDLKCTVEQYWV